MISLLNRWWRKRQRQIDLDILWPACKSQAVDLKQARVAFTVHALHDPAWTDFNEDEIYKFVDELT